VCENVPIVDRKSMSENVFIVENEGEKSSKREKFKEKY
jgi:hypothetical protein